MGCDIHVCTEKRLIDGTWWCADRFRYNEYYLEDDSSVLEVCPIYTERSYKLFSILADVRNYDNIIPISKPRGLPEDITEQVQSIYEEYMDYAHSESWLYAEEIFKYEEEHMNTMIPVNGMISAEQAEKLDTAGIVPTEWCAFTSCDGWVKRTWWIENSVIKPFADAIRSRMCEEFYMGEKNREKRLKEEGRNFRVVFWFDS